MAQVSDPCPQWAVFRMIDDTQAPERGSQISVLRDGDQSLLYCCHSRRVADLAGNAHVLSVGVDLAPALLAHGTEPAEVVDQIARECLRHEGIAPIPPAAGCGRTAPGWQWSRRSIRSASQCPSLGTGCGRAPQRMPIIQRARAHRSPSRPWRPINCNPTGSPSTCISGRLNAGRPRKVA